MTSEDGDETEVVADLDMTRDLAIQLSAVATLGLVAAFAGLHWLYRVGTGEPASLALDPAGVGWWTDALDVLFLATLGFGIAVPHEWLHGLAIRAYGGEPTYGVGVAHFVLPYAYATTDHEFTRNQFVLVLLTPLVVVTAVGVPTMLAFEWGWLIVPLAANAAGAVADCWFAATLLGYPDRVRVVDRVDGVRVLGRSEDRRRAAPISVTGLAWDAVVGTAVALVGVVLTLGVCVPIALPALGVDSLTIGTADTPAHVFSYRSTGTELSMSLGPGVLGIAAALGLGYAFLQRYRRGG